MTPRTRIALVALLAMVGLLAACSGTDEAGSDDSITADAPAGDSDSDIADAGGDAEEADDESGDAEPEEAEVRDIVTNVRESFDNVVEATSDDGVLVAVGLSCPEEGDPFIIIGARGLTGDAEYAADVVPELSFELRAVAQPDGTFRMQSDADPDVSSYTITLPTIGSGVTLELLGCAS